MNTEMSGRVCMVTGASSGIGKEIALGLAEMGATVVLVCRDAGRGQAAMSEIGRKCGSASLDMLLADLSSQSQIRRLAEDFKQKYRCLNVLVNNAGLVMDRRVLTEDGLETTFAVNYLAVFMLTNLLFDVLKAGAPSRVVTMTSMAHRRARLDFNNLQGEKKYDRDIAYAQSKLAEIIFTYELARRLQGSGIAVNCVCPGGVASHIWEDSNKLINGFFKLLMKGPEEGARLPLYLASSPEIEGVSGKYFQTGQHLKLGNVRTGNRACPSSGGSYNLETAARLWEISEKLTGLTDLK